MSETPPTIPPRKRPTTPVSGGGARPARTTRPGGAPRTVDAEQNGSSGVTTGTVDGNPPAPARPATAPKDESPSRPSRPEAERPGDAVDAPAGAATVGSAGAAAGGSDQQSPLVNAVDATTVWLKKAADVTSAGLSRAYSQLTRPRTEDAEMTTTPTTAGAATADRPAPRTTAPVTGSTARPATGRVPTTGGGPRRVRLAISKVDPWSVMKLAFLLSVAIGIMIVVAAIVVWFTLDGLHVFAKIDSLVTQVVGNDSLDILQYVSFERTVSAATLVAVIDVFLLTALATIGAFLYNIVAALVGGVHVTMTDE